MNYLPHPEKLSGFRKRRRLREAVRTARPDPARVTESGRALVSDLQLVIREDKRAA